MQLMEHVLHALLTVSRATLLAAVTVTLECATEDSFSAPKLVRHAAQTVISAIVLEQDIATNPNAINVIQLEVTAHVSSAIQTAFNAT
jgi:hypothetical protein